jgi:AraC-like DNA-binding protein
MNQRRQTRKLRQPAAGTQDLPLVTEEGALFRQLAASREFAEFALILKRLTGLSMALNEPDVSCFRLGVPQDTGNPICAMIRATDKGARLCGDCDRRHHARVGVTGKVALYTCHAGFYDMAVAVGVQGKPIAIISSGQILHEKPSAAGFTRLYRRLRWLEVPKATLRRAYQKAPWLPRKNLQHVMRLLEIFAGHLCESAWRLREAESQLDRKEIRLAKEHVRKHFADMDLQLSDIARRVGLSPAYFSHLFRQKTGMTLTRCIQTRRVEEAKRLLADTDQTVTEICFTCGFNSLTHFNRVFKAHTDMPPSHYASSRPHESADWLQRLQLAHGKRDGNA